MKKFLIVIQIFIVLSLSTLAQNVGIGVASPAYKLDVAGTLHTSNNAYFDGLVGIGTTTPGKKLDVTGDGNITGNLTVSGNKGLLSNAAGSAQLRYYTRTAAFTAILPAFGTSAEGSIGFSGFTNAPQVMVGDIVSTGGTVGQLYRVQLVIYDVTATGCHCRLINTSNDAVNYNITWNIICIGN